MSREIEADGSPEPSRRADRVKAHTADPTPAGADLFLIEWLRLVDTPADLYEGAWSRQGVTRMWNMRRTTAPSRKHAEATRGLGASPGA